MEIQINMKCKSVEDSKTILEELSKLHDAIGIATLKVNIDLVSTSECSN